MTLADAAQRTTRPKRRGPARPAGRPRRMGSAVLELVVLLAVAAVLLAPVVWMIMTSFKTTNDTFAVPPKLFFTPTLEHYQAIIQDGTVPRALLNSVIVAVASTLLAIVLGVPAAYALARFDFRGKRDLWFWFISNRFLLPIAVALPFYLLGRNLALLDTHLVLVLVYLTFNVPLVIWLCVDQFRAITRDIEEAAYVDGLGVYGTFRRIALPLAAPGIAVAAILCFIFSWNEFLFALVLTRDAAKTAPVEAANFMTGFGIRWGPMMATGTLIVLPIIVFAGVLSKRLVKGLTMGAGK
ncbi:MAG TPA: carbohydrate ABC transporter permease [Actinopolymorphaceae bacterium]